MLFLKFFISTCIILLFCSVSYSQNTPSFNVIKKGRGKQTVIFIAGFASSSKVWDETVEILSKSKTSYTIGFSGFAGSIAQDNPDLTVWENDIVAFIKKKRIRNPVLVGHSMGGIMALEITAAHPEMVSKLVVVDALPSLAAFYNPAFKRQENIDCAPFITQFAGMSNSQFYNMQKTGIAQMVSSAERAATILDWSVKSDRKTLGKIYCQFINTDLREKLSAITAPSLILLEPSFKAKETEVNRQYAGLRNADIRYADKGLHFIMYDDREWFINTLQSFLSR